MGRRCGMMILLLAAITAATYGQVEIGVKTGVGASRFDFAVPPEDAWSPRWTPRFGVFAAITWKKWLFPQIELHYAGKGALATGTYAGSEARIRERLAYLEGLALMNLRIWSRSRTSVGALAGVFGARNIGAKTLTRYQGETTEEDIRPEIRSLDYGVVAGFEGRWRQWRLDVRMTLGLADLRADGEIGNAVKNQSLSLTIGYGFRL